MSSGRRKPKRLRKGAGRSKQGRRRQAKAEKRRRIVRYFDRATRGVQHVPSVALLDIGPDTALAPDGSFGRLRVTAELHSGLLVTIEEDLADRRIHPDMPEVAPGLYLRKFVYSVWYGDQRMVAFHCDRTHRREGNPTYPYHRHGNATEDAQPMQPGDPRDLGAFLLYIRGL